MPQLIGLVTTVPVVLAMGAIFVLVLMVVHKTLEQMSLFGDWSGWIVAICVATLSVIGLLQFLGSPDRATQVVHKPGDGGGVFNFILLEYAALAISILLLLVIRTIWPCPGPRRSDQRAGSMLAEKIHDLTERLKYPGRPKAPPQNSETSCHDSKIQQKSNHPYKKG